MQLYAIDEEGGLATVVPDIALDDVPYPSGTEICADHQFGRRVRVSYGANRHPGIGADASLRADHHLASAREINARSLAGAVMKAMDAVGVVAGGRNGDVPHVDLVGAVALLMADDAVGMQPIRGDSEVLRIHC